MNKYIIYLLFSFIFLSGFKIQAQESSTVQNQRIELRIPSQEKIEKYKDDKNFQYESAQPIKTPWWIQEFLEKLGDLLRGTAGIVFSRTFGRILLIIVVTALIILIALRTQNISLKSLLGKRKMDVDEADFLAEDVNKMDFDQLITENLKLKNYRLVIRFLYLKNLKALSDKSIIHWNPNKTNYSYQFEITNNSLRHCFLNTTRIFDFVWYGEFVLDETNFQDAYNYFHEFNKLINNER